MSEDRPRSETSETNRQIKRLRRMLVHRRVLLAQKSKDPATKPAVLQILEAEAIALEWVLHRLGVPLTKPETEASPS